MFEAVLDDAGGTVMLGRKQDGAERDPGRAGSPTVLTDDAADILSLATEIVVDPQVRAAAEAIARRLSIRRPLVGKLARRGVGDLRSLPYREGFDAIDVERTLEALAGQPVWSEEDIVVRERLQLRRSVVLAVDISGSMRDERVRTAAATVGALAGELMRDDLAVVAFWSDAAWLSHFASPRSPVRLLDALVALPARGLTNVSLPLTLARGELAAVVATEARVVLLSDCVHNAGPDPRDAAARLPRLDILLDATGEHDVDLARQLAKAGRGRLRRIRTHRDVASALTDLFAP